MSKITVSSSHIIFKIFPNIPTHHNFNIALTSFSQASSRRIPSLEIPPQSELTSPLSRFVKLVADVNVLRGLFYGSNCPPSIPHSFRRFPLATPRGTGALLSVWWIGTRCAMHPKQIESRKRVRLLSCYHRLELNTWAPVAVFKKE